MSWRDLKDFKCPKCGEILNREDLGKFYNCQTSGCRFIISFSKFNELVEKQYKKRGYPIPSQEENQSLLNNL